MHYCLKLIRINKTMWFYISLINYSKWWKYILLYLVLFQRLHYTYLFLFNGIYISKLVVEFSFIIIYSCPRRRTRRL